MADLLSIGLSGLRTTQTSLTVTGHNIANVNTAGYSRQEAVQQTNIAQFSGAGYIGSGSQTVDVRRLASDFLTSQLRTANSQNAELQAFKSQISQLDGLLASSTTGINPAMQKFFATLQTAAQDPSSIPAREAVLAQSQGLAKSFNTLYDQLDKQNTLINQQLGALSGEVNSLATTVGSLNDAIARTKAAGADPNDLIDQRDEAVKKLSSMVGIQVVNQDAGQVNLFVGTGQPLVVGTTVSKLSAIAGADDPSRFQVMLSTGSTSQNVTSQISGGEMGGLLAYRDTALDQSYNTLGQLALTIADTVNKQLGQGTDLAGRVGANLFGQVNDPQAAALRVLGRAGNEGTATASLNITDTSKLTSSDYRLVLDSSTDPVGFSARRVSDNALVKVEPKQVTNEAGEVTGYALSFSVDGKDSQGRPITVDQGFEVAFTSAELAKGVAGDVFTLQPTRRGAGQITSALSHPDQLALSGSARTTTLVGNRGTGSTSQPALVSGPSPIDHLALEKAIGAKGIGLSITSVAADGNSYQLNNPAPGANWYYLDKEGLPLVARNNTGQMLDATGQVTTDLQAAQKLAPTLKANETNTIRLAVVSEGSNTPYVYEMALSGRPQQGDGYTVSVNSGGVSDNRNALALVALQTKGTIAGGGTNITFANAYGGLVERVGSLTAQVRVNAESSQAVLKQTQDNRDSLAGVNLDEEAANLVKFQQYYSASAQVIQVARSLFDTLIGAFR